MLTHVLCDVLTSPGHALGAAGPLGVSCEAEPPLPGVLLWAVVLQERGVAVEGPHMHTALQWAPRPVPRHRWLLLLLDELRGNVLQTGLGPRNHGPLDQRTRLPLTPRELSQLG